MRALLAGALRKPRHTPGARTRKTVESRDAEHVNPARHRQHLLRGVALGVAQGEFAHEGPHRRGFARGAGVDPLPLPGVLPLGVFQRELAFAARLPVAVDQHGFRLAGFDDGSLHRLADIDPDLIGQEIDQRQVNVTVIAEVHRQEEERAGKHDFQRLEGENLVGTVTPPHHEGHRQQHDVLGERLPRGEFQRLAETSAVLDGDDRGAQQRQQREENHRQHGEDRDQPDADLEQQHAAHHQLRAAQPDRKCHRRRLEVVESVDRKVFVDLQRRAPRVDHLRETRNDERAGEDQPADVGHDLENPGLSHRASSIGASTARIFSKLCSGESIAPDGSLQSTTRSESSFAAAVR